MTVIEGKENTTHGIFTARLNNLATVADHEDHLRVAEWLRCKLSTMVLQSRYARNPDQFVADLIKKGGFVDSAIGGTFDALDTMTISQMRDEVTLNEGNAKRLSGKMLRMLEKSRKVVAHRYALWELRPCLEIYYPGGVGLDAALDFAAIKTHWNRIVLGEKVNMPSVLWHLPAVGATGEQLLECLDAIYDSVQSILVVSRLMNYSIMNEIERCIAKGKMAGKGMMMDSAHVVSLMWADLFITDDKKLEQVVERAARALKTKDGAVRKVSVIDYRRPDQLAKLLGV